MTETIATRSGLALHVGKQASEKAIEIDLRLEGRRKCLLHWGLRQPGQDAWRLPPQTAWPAQTQAVGAEVQTPFAPEDGQESIRIRLPMPAEYSSIDFALFFPEQRAWDNNGGRNYRIEISPAKAAGAELDSALKEYVGQKKVLFQRVFEVGPHGRLGVVVTREQGHIAIMMLSDIPDVLLHWGIARYSSNEWFTPPAALYPPGTALWEGHTAQTPFRMQEGLSRLRLEIPQQDAPMGLQFVLKQVQANRWLRYRGGNFFVPVRADYEQKARISTPELTGIANQIVQVEMGDNSWTLMHRFNLCYDLLDRVAGNSDGLALLFVWLRYSALRQLTWQRQYNTQPRQLSHAQDRLTRKLAQFYSQDAPNRPLLRLLLASVGRGGEGQRIRDEILNIMHRHHVKEVTGHFLEEWHQKLHNNTTPDDIVLCEAYLEFLRADGNLDRFYEKLQEGGVTRQRLESFERPIRSQPDFVPHLKDALIADFQQFLRILRSVHAGTDLETAINAAGSHLDKGPQALVWRIWEHGQGPVALPDLVADITEARRRLGPRLNGGEQARELLYLDLALEQFLRLVVERNLQSVSGGDALVELIARLVENRLLSTEDAELAICRRHWLRLKEQPRFGAEWSLHAKSVVDRIGRVLGGLIDGAYQLLQPKAEWLGHAFHADAWVVTLFSEEVVRGGSLDFVLSMLLRHLEPILRHDARLGDWQIVSRGSGSGIVEVVDQLRAVQGKVFDGPRVVVAEHVRGDEEIPEAVTAVIAPDVTDIVSHVAVRARNAGLLFASCYDLHTFNRLKGLQGRAVRVQVSPAGDVQVAETSEKLAEQVRPSTRRARPAKVQPRSSAWALEAAEFEPSLTGGKALNLVRLDGKLPGWARRPASIAVPFGTCERVMASGPNRAVAQEYGQLLRQVETEPGRVLPALREWMLKLEAPPELASALSRKAASAGLAWPGDGQEAWQCIKRVWASKWNDRAFYSRRAQGIPHEDLLMSVLIQQVVEADHAFVLHTVNPLGNVAEELYLEVVLGLGETLVGNYPGRALSAIVGRSSKTITLLSYPGKSLALRGGGLIFRSDSNGEDLAGFAGAGLYESFLLPTPMTSLADYTDEPLVWNESLRREALLRMAELGLAVEAAAGAPQDIEGALSKGGCFIVQTRPQVGL
jgi:alpha-glucan,water dikinase